MSESVRLRLALSYGLTALGLCLAFLPWGWGWLTLGTGALSFVLARSAPESHGSRPAVWARRLSGVPVLVYAVFMMVVVPTQTSSHRTPATVVSVGELGDVSDLGLDEPLSGVVLDVEPCSARFIIRTTPQLDADLEETLPSADTRACFESLQPDTQVEVEVEITRRWWSGEVKSYGVTRIGDCPLSAEDRSALLRTGFCEDWSR